MGAYRKSRLSVVVLSLMLCTLVVPQSTGNKRVVVEPGVGFDGIEVGKTAIDEIISKYGGDYELIPHESYSQEFEYRRLGLSFYICKADPKRQVFVIEIVAPFNAETTTGIVLGKTRFSDVLKKHGEPIDEFDNGLEFEGVHFYYDLSLDPIDISEKQIRKRKVVGMDITEKSGLRQCDDFSESEGQGADVPETGQIAP